MAVSSAMYVGVHGKPIGRNFFVLPDSVFSHPRICFEDCFFWYLAHNLCLPGSLKLKMPLNLRCKDNTFFWNSGFFAWLVTYLYGILTQIDANLPETHAKTPNYRYGKQRFPYGKPPITVPIISRLTQGIHYQAHLCRCKTAAALCVTNGGKLLHKPGV